MAVIEETTARVDALNKNLIDNLMANLKAQSDRAFLTGDDFRSETKTLHITALPDYSVRTARYEGRDAYVTQVWWRGRVVLKDEYAAAGRVPLDVHEEYVEIVKSGEIDLYVGGSG